MAENYLTKDVREKILEGFRGLNPAFSECSKKAQWFIGNKVTAWKINGKRHTHKTEEGAHFLPSKERDKYFRKASDFQEKTEGIIETVSDTFSIKNGVGKAYRSTNEASEIILDSILSKVDESRPMEGRTGGAILSRDVNDRKPKCKGNIQVMQPVNREKLRTLYLEAANNPEYEKNERIAYGSLAALDNSMFEGYPEQMPNRYRETTGGRIMGIGFNLQNAPREVKNAALHNQYDHDIINCHVDFTIQLGKRYGVNVEQLEWYHELKTNSDKSEFHNLADRFTDNLDDFKQAMLALIYGAYLIGDTYHRNNAAIPGILYEGAADFINDCEIREFAKQAKNVRTEVVKHAQVKRSQLVNHLGKPLELGANNVDINSQYAHILHGYEAKMLHYALELYGDEISLLSHDGFVTKSLISTNDLTRKFESNTGLSIEMKTEKLVA